MMSLQHPLSFRSKGGKTVVKEFAALASAGATLRRLPGRRLFQYCTENCDVCHVTAREVKAFLREIAGAQKTGSVKKLLAVVCATGPAAEVPLWCGSASLKPSYWRT
jgi:hypothetical protein